MTELWSIAMVLIASVMGSFGVFMLKKGAGNLSISFPGLCRNTYLIGGILMYGLATLLFIPALKGGELSVLYPFISTSYIWTAFISMRFLGERMNKNKWLGIILIIIGVSIIGAA